MGNIINYITPIELSIITIFICLTIIAKRKILEKVKMKGWYAIVPIYSTYIFFKIAGKPKWIFSIIFPPIAIILKAISQFHIAKKFNKSDIFSIGMIIFPTIFYPILGFGKDKYDENSKMIQTIYSKIFLGIVCAIFFSFFSFFYVLYNPGKYKKLDHLRLNLQIPIMKSLADYLIDIKIGGLCLIDENIYFSENENFISFSELKPYIDKLKPGDILLTAGDRYVSSLIIPGMWQHSFIYVGNGEIVDASSKGIKQRHISKLNNLERGSLLRGIVAFRPNISDKKLKDLMTFIQNQIGKSYDFDYDITDKTSYFCSELIVDGLSISDINITKQSESIGKQLTSPQDIFDYIKNEGIDKGEFKEIFYLEKKGAMGDLEILENNDLIQFIQNLTTTHP